MTQSRYLTTAEVASALRVHPTTVQTWCREGVLPAERVGRSYRIAEKDFEAWRRSNSGRKVTLPDSEVPAELSSLTQAWLEDLQKGTRPYSADTIKTHRQHFLKYVRVLLGSNPMATLTFREAASARMIERALSRIPATQFSTRHNVFFAVVSFTGFLVRRGLVGPSVKEEMKPLKPRRLVPERRTVFHSSQEVNRFLDALWTSEGHSLYEKHLNAATIGLMVFAGLRVSEVANLELAHLDLANRLLTIQKGKGGKTRLVGINARLKDLIEGYLGLRSSGVSSRLLVSSKGTSLTRDGIVRRVRRLAKRTGMDITCHGLRRTFATLNAEAGRSVNMIQVALGHSSLATTQKYLLTDQRTTARAMTDW